MIEVYTDGSCIGNPGPGGWAAIFLEPDSDEPRAVLSGHTSATTNNRMEMSAVIEAQKYIHKEKLTDQKILLYSDSNLIVQTINQGWKKKKNIDLWEQLDKLNKDINIKFIWVKAHADNHWNQQADMVALNEAQKAKKKLKKGKKGESASLQENTSTKLPEDTSVSKKQQGLF